MKKGLAVAVAFVMMLALCATAFAGTLTKQDLLGRWKLDMGSVAEMLGRGENTEEMQLLLQGMTYIVEFTEDDRMVMRILMPEEVSAAEETYSVADGQLYIKGYPVPAALENDVLTLTEGERTLVMYRFIDEGAEPPAAQGGANAEGMVGREDLIGLWELNMDSLPALLGLENLDESVMAVVQLMTCTIEFTADGTCIMTLRVMGEETTEKGEYAVKGGQLLWNGRLSDLKLENNVLTIIEGDRSIVMTRKRIAQ